MKKLICVILSVLMTVSLFAACGGDADDGVTKVAIVQQLDHSSLDEIREAIKAQLNALAEPTNYTITIEEYNGQNDASMLNQIGTEIASGDFDIVIPIATLAAQTMVTALFDNLGKGASGAAIQNMNIMLGLDEATGLEL